MMIKRETRRSMRIAQMGHDHSPVEFFQFLSSALQFAPVEEWKELVPQLATGNAPGTPFAGPHSQRLAAQELAVLAFVAEEIDRIKARMSPGEAMAVLNEIQTRWEQERKGGR